MKSSKGGKLALDSPGPSLRSQKNKSPEKVKKLRRKLRVPQRKSFLRHPSRKLMLLLLFAL